MNVLMVIPTYNERANLEPVVDGIMRHDGFRVLVVDDHSPDGTGALADELAARYPGRVDVLHRTGARGLGRAYVDGIARALAAGADVIGQMDADRSHDPKYLPALAGALGSADLAIGSRYVQGGAVEGWPARRVFLSGFANRYIRMVTGLQVRDCTAGFRLWRRNLLAGLALDQTRAGGYAFLTETLFAAARTGARIAEVPIVFVERREGASKLTWKVLFESLLTPWRLVGAAGRVRAR